MVVARPLASQCSVPCGVSTVVVWRGDHELHTHQQGLKVLGVPLGHPDFVLKFLEAKIAEHRVLLERIPLVPDTQSAWLLLSFCAAARANFYLRAVNPDLTDQFAAAHDDGVWECLCRTLKISPICGAWDHFFCGKVDWAFAVQQGPNLQPIGQAGQTR